jgi:hypothetical protein
MVWVVFPVCRQLAAAWRWRGGSAQAEGPLQLALARWSARFNNVPAFPHVQD